MIASMLAVLLAMFSGNVHADSGHALPGALMRQDAQTGHTNQPHAESGHALPGIAPAAPASGHALPG